MPWFGSDSHHVIVYDVRPFPGDAKQFDPYFVAICECDWLGDVQSQPAWRFEDARKHSPDVEAQVKRPVG
jgi:hypothetical protein